MPLDQFLIAPLSEGVRKDVEPWLIPDEAFAQLKNAYVWRGRIKKRFGTRYIGSSTVASEYEQITSRLRIKIGTTNAGTGILDWTTAPLPVGSVFKIGQMFSAATQLFTVITATGLMISTGAGSGTFDTTNGHYSVDIGAAAAVDVYWYPSEPVMGFVTHEQGAVNDEFTYAFDTRFAYKRLAAGWDRLGTAIWSSTDYNFFWGENWRGLATEDYVLFVTNNSAADHVRYWDGAAWANLVPTYNLAGNTIDGCRLIVLFKDRLLFLNTWESKGGAAVQFQNRVRYCQNGTPLVAGAGSDATAWHEGTSTTGKGGYIDAPTKEAIISAKILRDRLIVFFERSTWELVPTGNKITPFVFQRINSEIGAESTFSTILFDKVLLGVGDTGIHACTGANVDRIDEKIPQEVFKFHNGNQGIDRVAGIRDYYSELAYWTIPDQAENPTYPTQVLVYDYKNRTWSLNDDSITAFGYIQNLDDLTWADLDYLTWAEWETEWNSGSRQSEYRNIIAGNQEGYTLLVDTELPRNAGAIQITNATVVGGFVEILARDHNCKVNDFILIENAQGTALVGLNGIHQIAALPTPAGLASSDGIGLVIPTFSGTYLGGGTITRISEIDIQTKEYNFYQKDGADLFVPKISFYVDRTSAGQYAVDYSTSSSSRDLVFDGESSGAILGTSILETTPYVDDTYQATQNRFWHVIYPQAQGEVIQFTIYLDIAGLQQRYFDGEITAEEFKEIVLSDFTLNAISIYARGIKRY